LLGNPLSTGFPFFLIKLKAGFVGLGRMGLRMVNRLVKEHSIVAYDINEQAVGETETSGAEPAITLNNLADKLPSPRVIWLMVPAGDPVDSIINELVPKLNAGDTIIDGGNSYYKDSVRRAQRLNAVGVHYLDVGTSGGIEGAENGASLTVGGSAEAYNAAEPLLLSIARKGACLHVGPSGSGHYVKMVHNGLEYTMLQAIGEGFETLESGPYNLDLPEIARVWNNGCVIRSWMLELAGNALERDPHLDTLTGDVGGGETGRWALESAMEQETPTPALAISLIMRYRSRQQDTFTGKMVAAIRREFGGHTVKAR
jgi:6-phosphogluconate dehydrogenase